jgi:hypothetical protein
MSEGAKSAVLAPLRRRHPNSTACCENQPSAMAFPKAPAYLHQVTWLRVVGWPAGNTDGANWGYSGRYLANRWWPEHNGIAVFDCRATRHPLALPRCGHSHPRGGTR